MPNNHSPFYDRPIFALSVVVGTTVVLILLDYVLGKGFLSWDYWLKVDGRVVSTRSEIFRNLGLFAVAVVGLGFGIWRAWTAHRQAQASEKQATAATDQWRIAEQGQITDRYTEAVKMLSDSNARTRTGAVYALARIAQDSIARDHIPVMEVLTEFVRNPPYQKEAGERAKARRAEIRMIEIGATDPEDVTDMPPPIQCPDIHAALQVIADRIDAQKEREKEAKFTPSLRRAALQELDLTSAVLAVADLAFANLTYATLAHSDLTNANLAFADLAHSDLSDARLNGAYLTRADLSFADLTRATLTVVDFTAARLTRADLAYSDLSEAYGLTQKQFADCRASAPPGWLPDGLTWPFVEKNGEWVRKE